jgi:hypothetical protein
VIPSAPSCSPSASDNFSPTWHRPLDLNGSFLLTSKTSTSSATRQNPRPLRRWEDGISRLSTRNAGGGQCPIGRRRLPDGTMTKGNGGNGSPARGEEPICGMGPQ